MYIYIILDMWKNQRNIWILAKPIQTNSNSNKMMIFAM